MENNQVDIQIQQPTEEELSNVLTNGKWDYKNPEKNSYTKAFHDRYFTKLKGKDCILAGGCIVLAHKKGIKTWTNEILQLPTKDNDNMCIIKSKIVGYGYDYISNSLCNVEFEEIGDASPKNCNANISAHFIRMATTRACNRVAKRYVGLDCVSFDELAEADDNKSIGTIPVNKAMISEFNNNIRVLGYNQQTVQQFFHVCLNDNTNNIINFNYLSFELGNRVLGALNYQLIMTQNQIRQ